MTCPNGHATAATDYCDTCGEAMPAGSADAATPVKTPPGAPGEAAADLEAGASAQDAGSTPCPSCGVPNASDALFCENCGYDHTTGAMPRHDDPFDLAAGMSAPASPSAGAGTPSAGTGMPAAAAAPSGSAAPGSAAAPGSTMNSAPPLDPPWVAEVWIDPQWYAGQESPDQMPSPGLPLVVPLRHTSLLIGRVSVSRGIRPDVDCGIDNGVSRRHAQLTWDGQRWWIEDLASSNGTFLGAATEILPMDPIPVGAKREIAPDDRIYVGSWTRIVLRPAADGEA